MSIGKIITIVGDYSSSVNALARKLAKAFKHNNQHLAVCSWKEGKDIFPTIQRHLKKGHSILLLRDKESLVDLAILAEALHSKPEKPQTLYYVSFDTSPAGTHPSQIKFSLEAAYATSLNESLGNVKTITFKEVYSEMVLAKMLAFITDFSEIVTICGTAKSGKTTLGEFLFDSLHYEQLSAGNIIARKFAIDHGFESIDACVASFKTNPALAKEYDKAIDEHTVNVIAKKSKIAFDSRLGKFFLKEKAFGIFLKVTPKEAGRRMYKRMLEDQKANKLQPGQHIYKDEEEAVMAICKRNDADRLRYLNEYGYDMTDESNYDLVIDTMVTKKNQMTKTFLKGYIHFLMKRIEVQVL